MRIGTLAYATSQGLGHLAKSFYDAGVITDPVIFYHSCPARATHAEWYPKGTPVVGPFKDLKKLGDLISKVDAFLFFETPFDWNLINACRERGVKTILMPMYEWTPRTWPAKPDALVCPSLLDLDYFKDEFQSGMCEFIPVPVDPTTWRPRAVAKRFLHNAGNVGHREHKGTRQLLEAMQYVKSPIQLTVRAQDNEAFTRMCDQVLSAMGDPRVVLASGEIPYGQLWEDHDVYVAPEKFNGLSLPLQEARAAGLMVMASDRFPHNSWLPREPLIPSSGFTRACISRNYREFDEAVMEPRTIAKHIDEWYGRDISGISLTGRDWAEANCWEALRPKYLDFFKRMIGG